MGYAKLARESGLANNTVASGYIEQLSDLFSVLPAWLVAQEIWRRSVLRGVENPEAFGFWSSKEHEIDFVTPDGDFIEVKRGRAGPLDFAWFPNAFPKKRLTVICREPFESRNVRGVTTEDFLLSAPTDLGYADEG